MVKVDAILHCKKFLKTNKIHGIYMKRPQRCTENGKDLDKQREMFLGEKTKYFNGINFFQINVEV